jgi:carotenoid cleavage dioxygenase-like enzyme
MRIPESLFFFQNGARISPRSGSSILDGQGHITAIHVATGRVSEIHVPVPKVRVSLTDICNRRFLWCLITSMVHMGHVHTGTANTAVLQCDGDILAVEEGSKPYKLKLDTDNTLVGGEWLYHRAPMLPSRFAVLKPRPSLFSSHGMTTADAD